MQKRAAYYDDAGDEEDEEDDEELDDDEAGHRAALGLRVRPRKASPCTQRMPAGSRAWACPVQTISTHPCLSKWRHSAAQLTTPQIGAVAVPKSFAACPPNA